jgi:hypothetical protein
VSRGFGYGHIKDGNVLVRVTLAVKRRERRIVVV